MAEPFRGTISVCVLRGRDLDFKRTQKLNPFVVLKLGNQVFKTRSVKRNNNPVWDEEFTFNLCQSSPHTLIVELLDKQRLLCQDEKIGKTEIDLHHLFAVLRLKKFLNGTIPVRRLLPSEANYLAGDSCITYCNG